MTEGDALGKPELTARDEVAMDDEAPEPDGITELTAEAESARRRPPEAAGIEVAMEDEAPEPDGTTELATELMGLLVALEVAKPELIAVLTADGLVLSELPPLAVGTPQT